MIKDELDTVETYIRQLVAVKEYGHTKAERDNLAGKVTELQEEIRHLTSRLTSETSEHKKTRSELKKKDSKLQDLTHRLGVAEQALSALRDFKATLPDGEFALEEMQKRFLSAQAKEIEARATDLMEQANHRMQSQMSVLVEKELSRVLKSHEWTPRVSEVILSEAASIADGMLRVREKWPEWFKDYFVQQLEQQLDKELNAEFEMRVAEEARKTLEATKTADWDQYSAAKARQLSANLRVMVNQLQGVWRLTCDRCQQNVSVQIGPAEIAQLLADRMVEVTCPFCMDQAAQPFILNQVPHKVADLTFANLLRAYLGGTPASG
jgi:hypothetical protein